MTGVRPKGDRFQIDFRFKGRRFRRETDLQGSPLRTAHQAQELRVLARAEIEAGTFDPQRWSSASSDHFTVLNQIDLFMDQRGPQLAPGTRKQYLSMFNAHIKPGIGPMDCRELTSEHVRKMLARVCVRDFSPILVALRALFSWLEDNRTLNRAPRLPKTQKTRKRGQIISRTWQLRLLELIPGPHRPIFTWLFFQSCRPSEARALLWQDIEGELVHYRRTFSASELMDRTKTDHDRVNWIFPEVLAALPRRGDHSEYVFLNPSGQAYSESMITRLFRRALETLNTELRTQGLAEIEISLYRATKHSTGTYLHRRGVRLETLKKHMGHTSLNTAELYVELEPAREMKKEVQRIGGLYG